MIVNVSERGQVTIPKKFREALGINQKGRVLLRIAEGKLVIEPLTETVMDLRGAIEVDEEQDLEKLRQAAAQYVARRNEPEVDDDSPDE